MGYSYDPNERWQRGDAGMDPLAQAVLLNASARQSGAIRATKARQRYNQARGVKERTRDGASTKPWNRLYVDMRLHVCDSVKEALYGRTV